jgi:urea transport system permease protein
MMRRWLAGIALALAIAGAQAMTPEAMRDLASGDADLRDKSLAAIVAAGDPRDVATLSALIDGDVKTAGERVLLVKGDEATDLLTGARVAPIPDNLEDVVVNNRFRRALTVATAALRLNASERSVRAAAAKELSASPDAELLPAIEAALAHESDPEIKASLTLTQATIHLASSDKKERVAAIGALARSDSASTRTLLAGLLERKDGAYVEKDQDVRAAAEQSLREVESRLSRGDLAARIFSGISLGSILLLAALGLAITYGLMGVINMAHGELIMVGAYTTYVVQNFFRQHFGGAFDFYLLFAVPCAFAASAVVGMLLERTVIRFLYGRPLETLLATWGLSLILIQATRTVFGAQNVQVENPSWMAGGVEIMTNVVLPWSRIAIIAFAALVLVIMWMLLSRTRLGLFVRAVTQNRGMASSLGVPTARVDMLAFGLGSGIAGLAGCALSQIGNVGPDLGQSYIVDSFMVVVLGGVGQLAGTVYAALGLGVVNKFLEAWSGAVLAKIAILVFIIVFIQKRPQGLFALKGRTVEA